MLYFNFPSRRVELKDHIEKKFLWLFAAEKYYSTDELFKAILTFDSGVLKDSIMTKDALPPDGKVLTSTGQVAGPQGDVYDLTFEIHVKKEEEGYKRTQRFGR